MEGQEFNAMWKTADSSEPVSNRNDAQADDSKHLFLNKQCFSIIECEEKWKLPDSSVMNPTQEVTNQVIDSVQVKEERPDDYSLPPGINVSNCQMVMNDLSGPFGDLGQNAVPSIMDSGGKFGQVQQELPALGQELMMSYSYPPRTQPITYQNTSNDSNCCGECGKSFSCNRSFRRHMLVHTGARPFHCKDCGRAFSRKDSLLAHERRHRRKTTHFRYQCQQCGINFLNSFQLKVHEQLHISSPASSSNHSEGQMENVIVSNPQSLSTARPCIIPETRPATSNYDDMLQSSISPAPSASILSDKKLHRCPLCRKLFTKIYAMNLHMKTHMIHMFNCEYCGKVFRFRRNKQIHVLKFHHKFQCMQCQRSFTNPDALSSHQLVPCNNGFNMNEILDPYSGQNQMQSCSTSEPVMHCKCGSSFFNQADLQKHTDVCKHQASSIQSSSGYFYSTSSDGNVSEIRARAVSQNLLTGGQQTSEVCSMQDTVENSNSSEVCNPVLQCNICTSRLEKPRTLACTHSFCHACLENCLQKSKSTLSCPTCQLVVVIPDGDLAHLQSNQMISSLLSEVQNSEQQMYPLCIVCDVNASHHCQQCDAFICIKCSAAHLKLPATKDHTQISLTEYNTKDPRERMAATVVMCKEHDSPSQFFCSSCQKLICVGCTLVDHPKGSEHEITDLSSAFQAFCTATEPMMSECEKLENKLCSAMDEMKPILQIGHRIRYKCRESIQAYITKLRAGLDKLQDKLLLEVDELTTDKQMAIDSRLDSLKRELEDVKGTRLLANQLITSPNKALALTLTSDVAQHLKDLLDRPPQTSDLEAKKALKFTPCEDLLEVILQKGIGSLEETDESESELQSEVVIMIE